MTRTSPIQLSMSSGEVSPLLYGRTDYQRHQTGLRAGNGWLPLREGGLTRAPGTLWRGNTLGDAAGRLIGFIFAEDDAVVLEFTALKMRVWRYGALVGAPYELTTPYDAAAVARLRYVQSADVIYLADGVLPQQKLSRLALDNWTIEDWQPDDGPFRSDNTDTASTVQASAETGTVTLTASQSIFSADMVDGLFQLRPFEYDTIPLWTGNTAVAVNDLMRASGNIYRLAAGTNTGATPPSHTEGTELVDKTNGTKWEFRSDGRGVVRITGYTSPTQVTATVLRRIPSPCVAAPTYLWAEGAWSDKNGYPSALDIADQRLVFAGTSQDPRTVMASAAGGFTEFLPGVEADSAFSYTISGSTNRNRIIWIKDTDRGLAIGALGQVLSARSTDNTIGLSVLTTEFRKDAETGVSDAAPIAPDGRPIFIGRDKARVFEISYSFELDANQLRELSGPAEHLGAAGFEEIVWTQGKQRLAWIRRTDGTLAAMLHDPVEDVLGWVPLSLAGGAVESLAVTPDATSGDDVVTMIVRRTVNGQTVRFVEELAPIYGVLAGTQPIAEAVHYFAAAVFTPVPDDDTFAVPHLDGEDVYAWTDAGDYGPITVTAGSVTLPDTVGRATIGLFDATHEGETLDIRAAAPDGSTLGRRKRLLPGSGIRLHRTAALDVAARERALGKADHTGKFVEVIRRQIASDLTTAYSGVAELQVSSGDAEEVSLVFRPVGGAPATILPFAAMIRQEGG